MSSLLDISSSLTTSVTFVDVKSVALIPFFFFSPDLFDNKIFRVTFFCFSLFLYLTDPPQNVTDLKYEYYDQENFKASWNLRIDSYRCGMATEAFPNSTTVISAEYAGSEEE